MLREEMLGCNCNLNDEYCYDDDSVDDDDNMLMITKGRGNVPLRNKNAYTRVYHSLLSHMIHTCRITKRIK